jgi:hypothetical protein
MAKLTPFYRLEKLNFIETFLLNHDDDTVHIEIKFDNGRKELHEIEADDMPIFMGGVCLCIDTMDKVARAWR